MRVSYLLLTATTFSAIGCSAKIAVSGLRLDHLTTRDEVHAAFGQPQATGHIVGHPIEDYTTHRKIAEPWKGEGLCMICAVTLGLSELLAFPGESYDAIHRSIVGQHLRFEYDYAGNVISTQWDGEAPFWGVRDWNRTKDLLGITAELIQKKHEPNTH